MAKKSISTFISSAKKNINESNCDVVVEFPDDIIKCSETEYINLNVVSFDMLNTMYNINSTNNTFNILVYDDSDVYVSTTSHTIPAGNYSVISLKAWLIAELSSIMNVTYNAAQNTFTFTKTIAATNKYYLIPDTCGQFLGLLNNSNNFIPTSGFTTSYINLVNYNKIILRTQNINYFMNNIENLHNYTNKLTFSDIIFWKSKQEIEPFKNIAYSNEDSGNSFNLTIQDKYVSNIRLQLKNENGDFITDAPNYLLVLNFSIYDKEDYIKASILSITQNVRSIWISLLWALERMKLLQ